ncbi:MAG: hypothetical protein MJ197_09895 [Bacteroidales bacterium]|nr:hypothetical protein [Bacteroidales bacterium]
MTIEDVRAKMLDLTQAIREYKNGKDYNSDELEILVDDMLCRLPRDVFYIEWFDRSQIREMADSYTNNDSASEDKVDECMYNLWRNDDSYMTSEDIMDTIGYTMNQQGE